MLIAKAHKIYDKLRSSYWFIPALFALVALIMAVNLLFFDFYNQRVRLIEFSWITLTGAEGSRAILTTVAGSMITVIAIVFSITIVSLSLASQQFGPRLLQNFMRDRGNQYVLGTVTATFLYCLLVLRTISETSEDGFVPHISILFAVLLGLVCVGVLVYFIHHVAEAIQVTNIIANVSGDLAGLIDRLFPDKAAGEYSTIETDFTVAEALPRKFDQESWPVASEREGYLQMIDQDGLRSLAEEEELIIKILHRHGHFVLPGEDLVLVWSKKIEPSATLARKINNYFFLGAKRTLVQDMEFLINELVEIAGKALSPGINDPFTAITCIDNLGARLSDLACRVFPSVLVRDREKEVRVVTHPVTYPKIVEAAFNQVRQYGRDNAAITIRLLETIDKLMYFTYNEEHRQELLRQANMIDKGCCDGLLEENDRQKVHQLYQQVLTSAKERIGMNRAE